MSAFAVLSAGFACGRSGDARVLARDARSATRPTAKPSTAPAPFDELAFALLRQLTLAAPERGAVVSPLSAGLALSVALEGAAGSTRDSLAAVLAAADDAPGDGARRNAALIASMKRTQDVTLTFASALWTREGVSFSPDFLRSVREGYGVEVAALDLAAPAAVDRINAWAHAATAGRVPTILSATPPSDEVALITSAVYFKGRWASAFDATVTASRPFHLPGGSVVPRPLMEKRGDIGHARGESFGVVRLPYRGGRFAMYVVVPDSGRSPAEVLARLTAEHFRRVVASLELRPVALALPRFTLACAADLAPAVASLGAANAFDRARADFGRMLAPGGAARRVWIGRAVQRSFVEVTEEGTEAAAVTAVEAWSDSAGTPSPPLPFVVDRPFLFALRDDRTGTLLFVGQVSDPAGQCGGNA